MHKLNRRQFIQTTGTVGTAGLVAGCIGGSDSSDGSLEVLITYFPDMVFSPLTGAKEWGYFDDVGLDVNIDSNLEVQNPLQVMVGGEYDIVVGTPFTYVTALSQDIPVETVATTIANTPMSYASMADSDIDTVEDWPNNVLGLQNEVDRNWITPHIYEEVGFSDEEIDSITENFIGYDVTNLTEGQVDIMSLYPTNSDFNSLRLSGQEFTLFESKDYTNAPGNVALTTEQFSQNNSDTLTEFTRAWAKACEESLNPDNRDRFAEMVLDRLEAANADVFLGDVDPMEVERSNFDQFLEYRSSDAWEENGIGYSDPDAYYEVQELGVTAGDISEDEMTPKEEIVNNQYIEEIHDDSGSLIWDE